MKKAIIAFAIVVGASFAFTTVKSDKNKPAKKTANVIAKHAVRDIQAMPAGFSVGDVAGGWYYPNQTLATNGMFKLVYQSDGNLVLSSTGPTGRVLWASGPLVNDAYGVYVSDAMWLYRGYNANVAYKYYGLGMNTNYINGGYPILWTLQGDGNFVEYFTNTSGVHTSVATGTAGGAVSSHFGSMQ